MTGWTDSHCHLQDDYLPDGAELQAVLARASAAGVSRVICVGTDPTTSRRAVDLAAAVTEGPVAGPGEPGVGEGALERPKMWATVGLHPHDASAGTGPIEELLVSVLEDAHTGQGVAEGSPRPPGTVVAVGECGLDYYYEHAPREAQRRAFVDQIGLAKRFGLALVIHTRDAWDDTVSILEEQGPPEATVLHCFTGGPREADRLLALGAYLSFSGITTFKNATDIREAAKACPADRLLVETDAPFLAPVPHRGRPNEPSFVTFVGGAIAALRGELAGDLEASSSAAATAAFALG